MGKDLYDRYQVAREVFKCADEACGFHLSDLIFNGPAQELTLTWNAQPAILTVSYACASVLREHELMPDMVAGLSLGEYTALVVAGSISFEDAVVLTRKRGKYMQEACPPGEGAMAAIIGLTCAEVEALCFDAEKHGVVTGANYNCPGQVVISGTTKAVDDVCSRAIQKGARVMKIEVSAPFHCSLMQSAREKLKADLERISISPPAIPVYANASGDRVETSDDIRQKLLEQVTNPVLWQVDVESMVRDGAGAFVEVGPGKSLTGFVKRIVPSSLRANFSAPGDLESVLDLAKEALLR